MIYANELRIGNMVIGSDGYCCELLDYDYLNQKRCDQYNPIPLTPEILEAAGFEYLSVEYAVHYKLKQVLIEIVGGFDPTARIEYSKEYSLMLCDVKYLHQLQNLYFALNYIELDTANVHQAIQ